MKYAVELSLARTRNVWTAEYRALGTNKPGQLISVTKMPVRTRRPSPLELPHKDVVALGLEGSANKLGAGIVKHTTAGETTVMSNVRHTYNPPAGEGFLPRDTALHHREWSMEVIKQAIQQAGLRMQDIDCICFTKGLLRALVPLPLPDSTLPDALNRSWYGSSLAICRASG